MEFKKTASLELCIRCNTEFQKRAEKENEQNAKLRHNAVFGRLTENPKNEFDEKIVTDRKNYLKWLFIFKNEWICKMLWWN